MNIDLNTQLQQGQEYTFRFNMVGATVTAFDPVSAAQIIDALSGDSNFSNVLPIIIPGIVSSEVSISFVYSGAGSNAGDAGRHMMKTSP